jgi:hypothetical protein
MDTVSDRMNSVVDNIRTTVVKARDSVTSGLINIFGSENTTASGRGEFFSSH